jgi:thiamine-phosphate pyrophosphorylase
VLTLPSLYAILDVETVIGRGWVPVDVCRAWLSAGVQLIQLRAKSQPSGVFVELADEVGALCRAGGATLIINDRADIAAVAGASGVHVGQDDLSPAAARRVVGPEAIVGLSTHSQAQIVAGVQEPVSYVAIGPVFSTSTKATEYEALGLDRVREAKAVAGGAGVPLVAIGGLTLERARAIRDAGADALAVISDLLPEGQTGLEARARAWVSRLV